MSSSTDRSTAPPELLDGLLQKTSRTFALSIPMLPEPTRREVTVAYLVFRIADTLEDATHWTVEEQRAELQEFVKLLSEPSIGQARLLAARWLAKPPLDHAGYLELLGETPLVTAALLELEERASKVIRKNTIRTTEQMASFLGRSDDGHGLQLKDIPDLQAYCYAVAGIVGEMLTELYLLNCSQLEPIADELRRDAAPFGEALQLVNILRDSGVDTTEGRNYLPRGVDRAEVFALARRDLKIAGRYVLGMQQAGAKKGLLAFNASPVLLAWATLQAVEKNGPGAKLSRPEVAQLIETMNLALDLKRPVIPSNLAQAE